VHSLDAWLTHADSAALGYVGPALWDGDDQALIPQNLHSSPRGVPGHPEQLYEVLLADVRRSC
jgi:hypothetical protein